ncbi:MAG: S-adenosylmethionine decarboxylase [Candidatus Melainabacteria bacterium]|nr:S-adenosylmethionine decarboxylase [Candidatus Melainabacteria bacterium]
MNEQNKNIKSLRSYRTIRSIQSLKLKKDTKINRVHVLLDLYQCDDKALAKASLLEQKVKKILEEFKLEPKIQTFYQFQPFGVTAIVCADGIQFTVHTWPEYRSAAIDLYSFELRRTATQICNELKSMFKSGEYEMKVRRR